MPTTTQQLPNPTGLKALRGSVVMMPRHPEDLLAGAFEQRVVDRNRERRSRRQKAGHDQIGQCQPDRVGRPSGHREESVRTAVMPQPF
jgi:hypothetical protein